ncbi:GNAT family N-acetyltransferase [Pedobacter panaciterrae]|jgi:Predicted acetyltransferase|uniref:GNAT family N-acetyltransferase n=1 Tax=Pedobacter panaciterrae TaxID=363849 RepID=A0ABU8NIC7_9SPHI|nr:GNAT family N-acetyltransferase [Pedobacter panaciterrae]NQX57046.1 N-acetyltransferase [Pedobacter panaciterrae]
MNAEFNDVPLIKNSEKNRFELKTDNYLTFIDYKEHGKKIWLIHTEAPEELKGRGTATAIVEKTLAYLEDNDYKLIPLCPFVVTYLKRHTEWNRILDEGVPPF